MNLRTSLIQALRVATVLVGIAMLAFLLGEPHLEGRNVGKTLFEIYFNDLFLAYVYLGSIPFFVGLYQVFNILGYVGRSKAYSHETVRALSVMRLCALVTAGALFAAITYVAIHARLYPEVNAVDGPEGAIVLGALASCTALAIVAFLTKAQNGVQETLRSKESEM